MGSSVCHCVCCIHHTSGCTPSLEYVYALVQVYMPIWLPMSTQTNLHSYMERWVPLCGRIFVSHSPHYVASTCMECVHASVHVFMSIWLLASPQTPMHSYTDTWEPPCGSVFVSQSPHFYSFTLFIMCTCIRTCIHVYLIPHVSFTPLAYLHGKMGSFVCVSFISHLVAHLG